MTNDETILREVDQALAEDRQARTFKQNLPAIVAGAAIVVAGVGGWQWWTAQRAAAAKEASFDYAEALKAPGEEKTAAALETLSGESGGYSALARMQLAGAAAEKGEREKALALYREVYQGSAGSKRLKDVARLRAAYLALADGREAVLEDAGPLETDETALGFYAREAIALAALDVGDYQRAEEMFRTAASSPQAPEPIRLRAEEFAALAGAGKAGVKFPEIEESKKSDVDRYLEGLKEAGSDLSSVLGGDEAAPGAVAPESDAPEPPEGSE